jgi:hypothetical protein
VSFYLSSWSNETYNFLSSILPKDCLLPAFPIDRGALDSSHTSARGHRAWVDSVNFIISK